MYGGQPGQGAGPISTVAGGALLPNTGGNVVLTVIAIASIVLGVAIMLTSVARVVAQKANKA